MAKTLIREIKDGYAITTDAVTATPIATFDISTGGPGGVALNNCAIFITARCALYDLADGQGGGEMIGAVFKVVSGTLSKIGATTTIDGMTKDTGGAPNCDLPAPSGTVITFSATGVAATTLYWFGVMDITVIQPV